LRDAALPRGSRAALVAAAAVTAVGALSARLATANFLIGVAAIAAWWAWRRDALSGRPWARPLLPPLALFTGFSVLSAVASSDPLTSLAQTPRLAVLGLVPLAAALVEVRWWRWLVAGLAVMAGVLAVWGIVQYLRGANDLENRISGPLSHYMTYSGWLMLAVLVLAAAAVLETHRLRWLLVVPTTLGMIAVVLSYTRNAWVGLAVGLLVLAAIWRRRVLLLYPLLAVVVWLVFPRAVVDRAISIVDLRQPANYDRLCMVVSGTQMVRDHPWLGVGPDMVSRVYPLYRRDDAPRWRVPHLHNNLLQIAAERGLPALGAYTWLVAAFLTTAWKGVRGLDGPPRAAVAAAMVGVVGTTVAGLFEYNFWDAEIEYLTLVLMGMGVGFVQRGEGVGP
jgi:O-antigen ligase